MLHAIDELGIKRLATDSRQGERGDSFLGYPGGVRDGRNFIAQALAHAAASVLWESCGYNWNPGWRVANLGIADLRRLAGIEFDIALVAGEGHERYQEVDGVKHAFSDSAVVTAALQGSRS